MQRFGIFTTVMVASVGGSAGLVLTKSITLSTYMLILGGAITSLLAGLLALRSYIKINRLLKELKNV